MLFKQTKHNKYHWQLFLWGQNWWFAADPEGDFFSEQLQPSKQDTKWSELLGRLSVDLRCIFCWI